jgi:hypothetical protein
MSALSSNSLVCHEDAIGALAEIRACHDELQIFLAETFDRLDEVVGKLRGQPPAARGGRHADPDTMQDQINHLTQLVNDLARTVNTPERPAEKNGAQSSEAKP